MDVHFLDVGQGSASVILLGDGRAILIDAGPRRTPFLGDTLARLGVTFIERLVLTHSHADHSVGACDLLDAFQERIGQIWLVQDAGFRRSDFGRLLISEVEAGRIARRDILRLEVRGDGSPRGIFAEAGVRLTVIAPDFLTNLSNFATPNATSAVLVLSLGDTRVVFAGDSTLDQWRVIRQAVGRPLECLVLTVPHHGGHMRPGGVALTDAELDWLYTEAVRPRVAVISVGTTNAHDHPRPEVVGAIRRAGAAVFCTQLTRQCVADPEALRPGVLPLGADGPVSAGVPCGGSLRVTVLPGRYEVDRLDEHRVAVDRLAAAGAPPLCRA